MTDVALRLPDELIESEAWEQLRALYDPELGVSLVDLGLIYQVRVKGGEVSVEMTLTTPGCPMTDSMPDAVKRSLTLIPGVRAVSVDVVWEPRWKPEMMTEQGRQELDWQ